MVSVETSFASDLTDMGPLFFGLNLDKGSPMLFIVSMNQLSVPLIFFIFFSVSISVTYLRIFLFPEIGLYC